MNSLEYIQAIGRIVNNQDIFLYWKGRVALYAVLKAMGVSKGDEVIIPGFTCVVVPNAIKYLDATPVYVNVDQSTMNPSADNFEQAITSRTRAIIVQNTFGLSTEVDKIAELARSKNIFSIEDCTHGFGGTYRGKPNGSFCDASFFSTQWNKPYSTGIGGFAVVNSKELIPALERINSKLINPTLKDEAFLSALLFIHNRLLNDKNYWRLRAIYRFLSRHNLVLGSSQGAELSSVTEPNNYFKSISSVQVKQGIRSLRELDNLVARRRENAIVFTNFLAANGKYHVEKRYHADHSFLKYPILVHNRQDFENLAEKWKVVLGDWFNSPIYPVKEKWEIWDLDATKIPTAVYLAEHIVNLPTETLSPDKVVHFLEHTKDLIL